MNLQSSNVRLLTKSLFQIKTATTRFLYCKICSSNLGHNDEKFNGYRLMKWSISIFQSSFPSSLQLSTQPSELPPTPRIEKLNINKDEDDVETITYPTESWVVAQLLGLVESQGQRKFVIKCGSSILRQRNNDDDEFIDNSKRENSVDIDNEEVEGKKEDDFLVSNSILYRDIIQILEILYIY